MREERRQSVALQQELQDAAGRLALIRHGGIDEHFLEREAFGDALGQLDIGENAARDRQIARPLARKDLVKRGERHLFKDLLHRGRDILAPRRAVSRLRSAMICLSSTLAQI